MKKETDDPQETVIVFDKGETEINCYSENRRMWPILAKVGRLTGTKTYKGTTYAKEYLLPISALSIGGKSVA